MPDGLYALNFYSPFFADQLRRGRKTATIRLGDKRDKYERSQVVWVTVGSRHSRREKIFSAVIDEVSVKRLSELSPRDIERALRRDFSRDQTRRHNQQLGLAHLADGVILGLGAAGYRLALDAALDRLGAPPPTAPTASGT